MDQFMCLKLRTHSSVLLSWRYCEIMLVLIFPTQKWPQNISSCTTCMVDQNFLLLSNTLFSSVLTKDSFVQCGWIPFLSFSYPRSGSNFTVDVQRKEKRQLYAREQTTASLEQKMHQIIAYRLCILPCLMSEWAYQGFEQHDRDSYSCLAIKQKMQLNTSQYWFLKGKGITMGSIPLVIGKYIYPL